MLRGGLLTRVMSPLLCLMVMHYSHRSTPVLINVPPNLKDPLPSKIEQKFYQNETINLFFLVMDWIFPDFYSLIISIPFFNLLLSPIFVYFLCKFYYQQNSLLFYLKLSPSSCHLNKKELFLSIISIILSHLYSQTSKIQYFLKIFFNIFLFFF